MGFQIFLSHFPSYMAYIQYEAERGYGRCLTMLQRLPALCEKIVLDFFMCAPLAQGEPLIGVVYPVAALRPNCSQMLSSQLMIRSCLGVVADSGGIRLPHTLFRLCKSVCLPVCLNHFPPRSHPRFYVCVFSLPDIVFRKRQFFCLLPLFCITFNNTIEF